MLVVLNILFEIVQPTAALALTEGPSQPEVQSFEPIGTTDMVDVFSGDFNYNIPLFNLPGPNGGYPVNLAYHAGVSPDDEASWVGLGWNINPGSLVRNMRGLPDEFQSTPDADNNADPSGDYLEVKSDMKGNMTVGASFNAKLEVVGADVGAVSLSNSIYYNNYRGLGMSNSSSIVFGGGDVQGGVGLSMDSDNGVGVSASITLKSAYECEDKSRKLDFSFDGNLSIEYSVSVEGYIEGSSTFDRGAEGYGSSITFARSTFSPSLAFKMNKWNASFSIYTGAEAGVVFTAPGGSLFFNTEDMNDVDKAGRKHKVLGYDKLGNETLSSSYSKDFSRERDGQVTALSPYLPVANYTYDTYTSTGQGMVGFFRPHRNDVGRVHDPELQNDIYGGGLSLEVGSGAGLKAGIQANFNMGYTSQGSWNDKNELNYDFSKPYSETTTSLNSSENLYYKIHGEHTILEPEDINYQFDDKLAFLKFAPKGITGNSNNPYGGKRYLKANDFPDYKSKKEDGKARAKRNTTISNLKNSDVANLGEYKVSYYDWNSGLDLTSQPTKSFNRSSRGGTNIGSHYAGFKVLNEAGANYVYALPAYNNVEIENLFSTKANIENGTYLTKIDIKNNEVDYKQYAKGHQFIRKTKKSPFAHSYLLTSVQGADYVDLTNDGPSDDDLGYWVKFSYAKKADNFKWRSPYDHSKAFFSQGASYTDEDDKASYSYGEKELWYLGRMETKTHVAIFKMSERKDMIEAKGEIGEQDLSLEGRKAGLQLDEIVIYDKKSLQLQAQTGQPARFLQKIKFGYKYELCSGAPNSKADTELYDQSKLTLTSVCFLSNGSDRNELNNNKYQFQYNAVPDDAGAIGNGLPNPGFEMGTYDSWGTYKPKDGDEYMKHFPYTNQFNQGWGSSAWEPNYTGSKEDKATKEMTKKTQDALASVWSLSKITLPSGGEINVKYESDDYGYVQHKTANQMFKIASMGDRDNPGDIYKNKSEDFEANPTKKRIYFKLETPIAVSNGLDAAGTTVFNDYVKPIHEENGERYLYFKTKMKLTDEVHDYVSGYLPLENGTMVNDVRTCGVVESGTMEGNPVIETIDGVSSYTYGFVTVKSTTKIRNSSQKYTYHPMAIAGWTYLQTSATELMHDQGGFSDDVTESNFMGKIGAFLNILPEMISNWGGIKSYCASKRFCNSIDLDYSCIRLASPDKIKFGGGHRVKSISINDSWSTSGGTDDQSKSYGQTYDYTIEENGKTISSGVAAYEPQAGGDENALKYPYFYAEKQNYFTKNNLFTEAPYNESLFPGASVGYRKVTVTSINTAKQMQNYQEGVTPPQGRTGGIMEHYFYTAKEFPTLVEASQLKEENSTLDSYNLLIPIPLIGSLKFNYYHGTQAYMIQLNDMHGKPKAIKSYELNNYVKNIKPIAETSYEYQCEPYSYMGEQVWKLNNEVAIMKNDDSFTYTTKKQMGVEVDMFTDQRESKAFHVSAGLAFNVDWPPSIVFFPSVWPSYTSTKQLFRTYVTNKVIHRSGILKKTITKDVQTTNESEIVAYDEVSGNALVVKTKNEFGEDIYSYNIPAHYKYDLMGHAYRNIDYCFKTTVSPASPESCYYTFSATNSVDRTEELVRGDELLANGVKAYFLGWTYDGANKLGMLHAPIGTIVSSPTEISLRVIRSGRRNHYATMAANYLTKGTIADNGFTFIPLTLEDGSAYQEPDPENPSSYRSRQKGLTKNVLSATASLFMDTWRDEVPGTYQNADFNYYDPARNDFFPASAETFIGDDVANPYVSGNAGIWRSYKSYTYVGRRKSSAVLDYSATGGDPRLDRDGVFDEIEAVPVFNWELGLTEAFNGGNITSKTFKNWEWTNEVTRYNTEGYETENINRLGIFSSALYGYGNSLSIGVGGNASLHEIGVMDFETMETTVPFGKTMKENGLNFYNDVSNAPKKVIITEQQSFAKAIYTSGNLKLYFDFNSSGEATSFKGLFDQTNSGNVNWPLTYQNYQAKSNNLENTFGISLVSKTASSGTIKGNKSFYLNGRVIDAAINGNQVVCTFKPYVCTPQDAKKYLPENSYYYGKLTMLKKRPVLKWSDDISAVSATKFIENGTDGMKAHSGKKMMKVNGSLMFEQQKFCFSRNKSYVLSMWISRTNQDVKTYKTSNLVQPILINPNSEPMSWLLPPAPSAASKVSYAYGKIIEGWQKVDIEFTIADDAIEFKDNMLAIRFNTGGTPLYVDDVRLSPKTGGLKTFVYDPVTFWLKANLNVDNYATFYYYNQEGALNLTKQETEKGIFTVSESRSRMKKFK